MAEIQVYDIQPTLESLHKNLVRLQQDYDSHNHDGSSSRSFETLQAQTIVGQTMLIKKTSYNDDQDGFWMGFEDGVFKMNIGNDDSSLKWNGSSLTIDGDITGSTITGGTFQTASSGQRIRITAESMLSPTQTANSLALINDDGHSILDFGSSSSIIMRILPTDDDLGGLLVQSSGGLTYSQNLASFSILSSLSTGVALSVGQAGAGTAAQINASGTGIGLAVTSSNSSANYGIYLSTVASGVASLFITRSTHYAAIEIDQDANSASAAYGIAMAIANGGAGGSFAFLFSGSEVVNAAVGGSQDYKIRIKIGGTTYYIPCHTA